MGIRALMGGALVGWNCSRDGSRHGRQLDRGIPESARVVEDSLRELPHPHRMAPVAQSARLRSQQDRLSVAGYAYQGALRGVSRRSCFLECRPELPGLPRRHPSPQEWSAMRSVPPRQRLAGFGAQHQRASGPVPAHWCTRCRRLLCMPQSGNGGAVQSAGPFDRMRELPPQGVSGSHGTQSPGTGVLLGLSSVSQQHG